MNTLLLTIDEITKVTNGKWENFKDNLKINEFHITFHYLKENDIFVVKSDNWVNKKAYKNSEHLIKKALDKNISAIMVKEGIPIDTNKPVLRVENTYFALKSLAKYALKKNQIKKVLVTGSYGKTALKLHLHQIIKKQKNSYARFNSANYTANNYCAMASIKTENELFITEIPVARKEKVERKSKLISPDIVVLTSIGHEHIERFKSIENIIENKLSLLSHMKLGSKLLVNKDTKYFELIKKELKKYPNIDIRTYGQSSSNNAYILFKRYRDFGWDIIAKIENKIVSYRVPFFEEYAISNSLGVLLCAYHLGADIHDAANEYCEVKNFKSSGNFYKVRLKEKSFYLYDQSNRGGIEGYESFFKNLSYLKPSNKGRKILVTSEFVDYKDGEMNLLNIEHFQKIIEKASIDLLYSVEKFSEHIDVLKDKSIWKKHSIDFNNIKDEIVDEIQDDDILCVKGIFESNLPKFIEYIKSLEDIFIEKLPISYKMQRKNEAFKGLRTLEASDIKRFKEFVKKEQKIGYKYYFPFLYFWSLSKSRELLIDESQEGNISIFLFNRFNREKFPEIQQYLPTLPFSKNEQNRAFERVYKYKGYKSCKITWVDRKDVFILKRAIPKLKFHHKVSEFIYNPKIYEDLSGGKFRNLRQQLNWISKYDDIEIKPYEKKYRKECIELYDSWKLRQKDKYENISDEKYTKYTILYAESFEKEDLDGIVILYKNRLVSYAFWGEISDKIFCMYIGKSDHNIKGLQMYIKYLLLKNNKKYDFANDGEGISGGLDSSKKRLNPVFSHKLYGARISEEI